LPSDKTRAKRYKPVDDLTQAKDVQRAAERLRGILTGISIDRVLRDGEAFALNDWLKMHGGLLSSEPFKSTALLIKRCLSDGYIDEEEREEIIEWGLRFEDRYYLPKEMTTAVRRLHGVLNGIGIDGLVTDEEVYGLRKWLRNYTLLRDHWPFSEAWSLIESILADGRVTDDERRELLAFCSRFVQQTDSPEFHEEPKDKPGFQAFEELCDRSLTVVFGGKRFCFTGLFAAGTRSDIQDLARSQGGICDKAVTPALDYLVIGAHSSRYWALSSSGLKISKALEVNRNQERITFLHEDDFVAQARGQTSP